MQKTVEGMGEQERNELMGCFLTMAMIQDLLTTPATGAACTTHEDCAEVECPDQLFPKPAYCQNSRCKTQDDVCE
ncbi:hypothetical protein WMF38_05705 [Sorangium sp. So ce118]